MTAEDKFQPGDKIEYNFHKGKKWHPGTIREVGNRFPYIYAVEALQKVSHDHEAIVFVSWFKPDRVRKPITLD
jgi:hypothetical protein